MFFHSGVHRQKLYDDTASPLAFPVFYINTDYADKPETSPLANSNLNNISVLLIRNHGPWGMYLIEHVPHKEQVPKSSKIYLN